MNRLKHLMVALFLLASCVAHAHQLSTAYFNAEIEASGLLNGAVQMRLFDLQRELDLDSNGNGELTWGETIKQSQAIQNWLQQHVSIKRNNLLCEQSIGDEFLIDHHFDEAYVLIPVSAQCAGFGLINVSYNGLFSIDQTHKMLVNISTDEQHQSRVIGAGNTSINVDFSTASRLQMIKDFLWQGMIHIWIGLDHILFLLCLLLACFLQQKNKLQQVGYKSLTLSIVGVVTAFTLAHSITLTATALDWIQLPSRWVEISIAASVLVAAVNNIIPLLPRLVWITFAFGLLHGMGFAGALGELGLPSNHQVWTVLAFNLGVEIGQIAIIAVVLPVMILLRKALHQSDYYFKSGSAVIALVAVYWVVERI
ncbi:HupE/UreJ family protein [Marinicella sp. W31]|uniref:HupE/UreJ family protein n=1 Tax=Marinicella sp. W31 TaxID=3023713 RepID=UPI0037565BDD